MLTEPTAVTQLVERFTKRGLDSLDDCEIIELLFSLALFDENNKEQAKRCIREFGSLRQVIEASAEELQRAGVGTRGILFIRLISEIPLKVLKQRIVHKPFCESSQAVFDYLCYSMRGLKNEVFKAIYLNSGNEIIETVDLFTGTVNSIPVSPRVVAENAMKHGAASVIFAHNHPSGNPVPSKADKRLTRDLVFIGSVLQIKVLDHIIIGDQNYFSFAGEQLIQKYEDDFLTLRIRSRP